MSLSRGRDEEMYLTSEARDLRVASLVTSFNEDPEMVETTLISVIEATRGRGDVYLLDDSTNINISRELRSFFLLYSQCDVCSQGRQKGI